VDRLPAAGDEVGPKFVQNDLPESSSNILSARWPAGKEKRPLAAQEASSTECPSGSSNSALGQGIRDYRYPSARPLSQRTEQDTVLAHCCPDADRRLTRTAQLLST
jgi:hypothetical protein